MKPDIRNNSNYTSTHIHIYIYIYICIYIYRGERQRMSETGMRSSLNYSKSKSTVIVYKKQD